MIYDKAVIKPAVYTIATAHLDTSWNWELETTIAEYLPNTLKENFKLFKKFPDYKFNFEGSYRYELIEEYYPEDFETLKKYIDEGRWFVAGSSYENGDMNIPSPEALFRNILYGNGYFLKKFNKKSLDIFLPDCFGFGYALPSIAKHANLLGFSTQKLCWSSAYHVPFDLGKWYGVDGNYIYAALDCMNYSHSLPSVKQFHHIKMKLRENILRYNLPFTAIYHGVGDRGGAPAEKSVLAVVAEANDSDFVEVDVYSDSSDRIFRDIETYLPENIKQRMPRFDNELISTNHGVGCYTSRAISKRWNRKGEQLANAAERLNAAAMLCSHEYPENTLDTAWKRIIAHQFHDDITGTSRMKCYQRNWNDLMLSLNQFSEEYRAGAERISELLDTSFCKGIPLVVANPVQSQGLRTESVKARIELDKSSVEIKSLEVCDAQGNIIPSGIVEYNSQKNSVDIVLSASVPSCGLAVYDVKFSKKEIKADGELKITLNSLENKKYRIAVDENGDISSIYDKELGFEALSKPVRLAVHKYKGSAYYSAWEMPYADMMSEPLVYAASPIFEIVEDTAARVTLKVTKFAGRSKFIQLISLDYMGEYLSVQNEIDWHSFRRMLKVEFPVSVSNKKAAFDLGLGYIERGNDTKLLYEFPAQMWADISDENGNFGVSVFSDSKTGWDKPSDNMLRLTAIHTPKQGYREESRQNFLEIGLNRFGFAIYTHKNKVTSGTIINAENFNQPLSAFVSGKHSGKLMDFSLCSISSDNVIIRAVKKAVNSDEIIVRVNETIKKDTKNCCLSFAGGIISAREVFASEEHIQDLELDNGKLYFDMPPFSVKTFALTPCKVFDEPHKNTFMSLSLPYNANILSSNSEKTEGILFDGEMKNLTVPRELIPEKIHSGTHDFLLSKDEMNAVRCKAQKIELNENAKEIYIVAAALGSDREAVFTAGGNKIKLKIADMFERVGIWDMAALEECGHIKRDVLAWNATHMHSPEGDVYAKHAYFFKYKITLEEKCTEIILPADENIIIISAISSASENLFEAASEMYDALEKREKLYRFTNVDDARSKITYLEGKRTDAKFYKAYGINRLKREFALFKRK